MFRLNPNNKYQIPSAHLNKLFSSNNEIPSKSNPVTQQPELVHNMIRVDNCII